MSRSLFARSSEAAGRSWRKWEGTTRVSFPAGPWYEYRAGIVGLWLIMASIGALVALVAR